MKRLALTLAFLLSLSLCWAGRSFNGSALISVPAIGNGLDISSGNFTVSAWFNATSVPTSEQDIVSHFPGQWIICLTLCGPNAQSNGQIQWQIGTGGPVSGVYGVCGTISANQWYAVVMTVNTGASTTTFYGAPVGGSLLCSAANAYREQRTAGGNNLNMGGHGGTANFNGIIGEVNFWNTTLSNSQALALLSVCASGASARKFNIPQPIGTWPLYGASGASIEPDLSGNLHNGTLTGTAQANHPPCTP